MKNTNEERVFELNLRNPFTKKGLAKVLAGISVIGITVVGTYLFTDNYTLNFRSPILIQNPVIIRDRIEQIKIEPEKEEVTTDATKSAELKPTSPAMSNKLIQHINARPDVWVAIKKVFGDKQIVAGELIARESSFIPTKINPSSGACGLGQALPCKKLPCELTDTPESIECQLVWVSEYIESRYGTVELALAFHDKKGWY